MSLVLRPPLSPAIVPQITYVAALSLAQTFSGWVPREDIEIKWPNDVLVGGRKVAGILLEARMEGARAEHVVVGVGVNVGGSVADFPEELRDLAGTLGERAHKEAPTVLDVLCRFLQSFEEGYERFLSGGFEALREDWSGWFRMAGRRVRISGAGEAVEGEVVEMSPDGALVLRLDGGLLHRIHAGDVAWATTKS
jgi:BirA family biotin operon repressor/biotin-[acetyl-CoA-carboxylase] ligase